MGNLINMTGEKFGRWTVIERSYPNAKNKDLRWLCRCNCGAEKIVEGKSLRWGKSKSCGCLKREIAGNQMRLDLGLANMRAIIGGYKKNARKKGLGFNLSEEQFFKLTKRECYYCGMKPNNTNNRKGSNGKYIYNGLDRVDNTKYLIRDSGKREEYPSGAVRDTNEGKIRWDLLPIECLKRLAIHYTNGAKKYAANNWKKGIPTERFIESASRHWAEYLLGDTEEDHLSALVFNVFGMIYNEERTDGYICKKRGDKC